MPWAAGVYTRGYPSWSADAASNLPISATKFDTEDNDFAAGLNNCLTKDGLSTPNTPMTWGLSNGQVLNLTRGSDGVGFAIARTGGSNNPALQFSLADNTGVSLGFSGSPWMTFVQAGGLTFAQPVAFSAGAGLVSASFQGAANQYTVQITGSSTSGQSFGLLTSAGTTSADLAVNVRNQAGTANFLTLFGDGHGTIGPSATSGLQWTAGGNFTLAAPASGIGFTFTGVASGTVVRFTDASTYGVNISHSAAGTGPFFNADAGNTLHFGVNGTEYLTMNSTGGWNFAAPASGSPASFNGINNNYTVQVFGGAGSGQSFGLLIEAGTTSADQALAVLSQAASPLFRVFGDGGSVVANATGGSQGSGSLNAVTLFTNGQPVYAGIPQNVQTVTYQFVLSDANKHIFINTGGAHTFTIPANASVAFPIGTAITIINGGSSGNLTLAITSDTLAWYPSGTTGSRTLAPNASATILKVLATAWILTGVGIS